MNTLSAKLSAFLGVITLALVGLLVHEHQKGVDLANQLASSRTRMSDLEADRLGLEKANKDLHGQIETLRKAPPMFTLPNRGEDPELVEREPEQEEEVFPRVEERTRPQRGEQAAEERELTPEEVAAREERERQRQAWREEREKRREEFRQRINEEITTRKAFFSQVPLEGLAPEYREANQRLLTALDEVQAGMAQMANTELSRDERRDLMRQVWQTSREVSGLMEMQRDVLLNDYAQQNLGLDDGQTQGFIEYMQTIDEMTSTGDIFRGTRGGR